MAKIKDVFEEVFLGVNLSTFSKFGEKQEVYILKKNNIVFSSIITYDMINSYISGTTDYKNLLKNALDKINVPINLKEKYYLRPSDIIISIKKPYKTLTDVFINGKVIVNNNCVILRGIDRTKYLERYLTYYLENVGIKELLNKNNYFANELTLEDIKNIDIPNVSIDKQREIYSKITRYIGTILETQYKIEKILEDNN